MRFLGFLIAGLLLLPVIAFSQGRVGTSIVDGKTVDLYSDFTWRYRSDQSADAGCVRISSGLNFCGAAQGWKRIGAASNEIASQFRLDDRNYAVFVVEQLGSEDGMTMRHMRSSIIQNFSVAADISPEDVIVHGSEDGDFGGETSTLLIYSGEWQGFHVIYANTVVITANRTLQLITYSVAETFTDRHRKMHSEFLSAIRLE